MTIRTEAVPDGLRFISTPSGKIYRSLHYHRSPGRRDKSIWTIPRRGEFEIFCVADSENWRDQKGYWGFQDGANLELGSARERIAFFPRKSRSADDWHGFPVRLSPVRRPDVKLAEAWVLNGHVKFAVGQKIKRGKL
jgi:hypothetical protein